MGEADIAAATDREFTFGALGYDECCEVRVQTNAANCESEVAVAECCTFIDCPEVPQVECSLVVTTDTDDDETCIEVVAEWDPPASGNVDHIGEWMVASTETTVGKYVCGTSDTACGLLFLSADWKSATRLSRTSAWKTEILSLSGKPARLSARLCTIWWNSSPG